MDMYIIFVLTPAPSCVFDEYAVTIGWLFPISSTKYKFHCFQPIYFKDMNTNNILMVLFQRLNAPNRLAGNIMLVVSFLHHLTLIAIVVNLFGSLNQIYIYLL